MAYFIYKLVVVSERMQQQADSRIPSSCQVLRGMPHHAGTGILELADVACHVRSLPLVKYYAACCGVLRTVCL
jgi:hypothetical protein